MTIQRATQAHMRWVETRLSNRDWRIIEAVNLVRLLTGSQVERLFFANLSPERSRIASRSRVLHRLVSWRVLVPLPRRVGGAGRGSTGLAFALDTTGHRLMHERLLARGQLPRVRRPGAPTERTLHHILAVSEAYVTLIETARERGFVVEQFQAEPASWWPNGVRGYIKPDAYARLAIDKVRDHWWLELDLATESLPAARRQLAAYLDFYNRGQLGPEQIMPRVLIATTTPERCQAITAMVSRLLSTPPDLFRVVQIHEIANELYRVLRE